MGSFTVFQRFVSKESYIVSFKDGAIRVVCFLIAVGIIGWISIIAYKKHQAKKMNEKIKDKEDG